MDIVIIILLFLLVSFALLSLIKIFMTWWRERGVGQFLARYTPMEPLGCFEETYPKIFLDHNPIMERAVLLLHGYGTSPHEFRHLIKELKQHHIPYYAPCLTGFGLEDLHLLKHVQKQDWLRDVMQGYDLLSRVAEKVDVIGQSNGGVLALHLSKYRPIRKLILASPYLAASNSDDFWKKVVHFPLFKALGHYFVPIYRHPDRDECEYPVAVDWSILPVFPIGALEALWQLQDEWKKTENQIEELYLIYGQHDVTVNVEGMLKRLIKDFTVNKIIVYDESTHNLFEEQERDQVIKDVIDLLQ